MIWPSEPLLCDRYGPSATSALGGLLVFIGYFTTYAIVSGYWNANFFVLATLFFCIGLGSAGFFYTAIGANSRNFSRERRGMIVGYFLMLFGLTASWITAMFVIVLQQDVRQYLLVLAIVFGSAALLSTLFSTVNTSPAIVAEEGLPLLSSADARPNSTTLPSDSCSAPSRADSSTSAPESTTASRSASIEVNVQPPVSAKPGAPAPSPPPQTAAAETPPSATAVASTASGAKGRETRPRRKSKLHYRRGTAELPKYGADCLPVVSHPDFWLLFAILFLVAGSGLM